MVTVQSRPEGKVRILVVDDSAFVRFTVSMHFSQDPELEVVGQAVDGIQAISLAKELKPDVITLDVSMPKMDGLEALGHTMKETPTAECADR
jgi:two-component system chemotaxis response regulator CheB